MTSLIVKYPDLDELVNVGVPREAIETYERLISDININNNINVRLVLADWFEEFGFDDEAYLQRTWTPERQEAENYLINYARKLCVEDERPFEISYKELVEIAR